MFVAPVPRFKSYPSNKVMLLQWIFYESIFPANKISTPFKSKSPFTSFMKASGNVIYSKEYVLLLLHKYKGPPF